ncbi:MAG TPA: hypothetical protein VFY89_04160 [Ktedonobacterales bacterium]
MAEPPTPPTPSSPPSSPPSFSSPHEPLPARSEIHRFSLTKARAFAERAAADLSATYTVAMCVLGDRLGLFTSLAKQGPATSDELAERTGTQERYTRE